MKLSCAFALVLLLILPGCGRSTQSDSVDSLMTSMRENLGLPESESGFGVYALADCTGPNSAFTTLVISDASHTRFEQQSGARHVIGFHSADTSHFYSVPTGEVSHVDSVTRTFLIGHELHMIAFYPESRFGTSVGKTDTTFYGSAAHRLTFLDVLGGPIQVYYRKKDLLPLGFSQQNHLGRGPKHIDVLLEDWKEFDGKTSFFKARFLQGDDVYTYQFTDIRFEVPASSVFSQDVPLIAPVGD